MSKKNNKYPWAFSDQAGDDIVAALGTIPGRWGRMTPLCRLLIVKIALLLQENGVVERGERCCECGLSAGLVGGTRKGSLHTDLDFIQTMKNGPGLASPALFGYTLPNIPLAEAAGHHGLVGPVYALLDTENPLASAVDEAEMLLRAGRDLSFIVACEFDYYTDGADTLVVDVRLIRRTPAR